MVNEQQYSTAMLAALTANINRAEGTEPLSPSSFLKYPAAEVNLIDDISLDVLGISLNLVPSSRLAENVLSMREKMMSTFIWRSERFLYI